MRRMDRSFRHLLIGVTMTALFSVTVTGPAEAGCRKRVVLYDAHWCATCRQVKGILARNHIRYAVLDATRPHVQADMVRRFGDTRVPRTLIGGALVTGANETRIKALCR